MGIILEGADASGKSTLGRLIADKSGAPLHLSGPAPRNDVEMLYMLHDQNIKAYAGHVIDRVSCISQQVYHDGLFMRSDLRACIDALVDTRENLIVYCRPPDYVLLNPAHHVWKEYDTQEWKDTVIDNQQQYVNRYDYLMSTIPRLVFDWTDESATHLQHLLCEFRDPVIFDRLIEMANGGK